MDKDYRGTPYMDGPTDTEKQLNTANDDYVAEDEYTKHEQADLDNNHEEQTSDIEGEDFQITNKHLRSLAAILFMAIFVPHMLKGGNYNLSSQEEDFIKGYVKYGYILSIMFVLATIARIWFLMGGNIFANYTAKIIFVLLIIGIFVGIFMIFTDRSIMQASQAIQYNKIKSRNTKLLSYYMPIYNFYLWQTDTDNMKSYRWLKESIMLCLIWLLIGILTQELIWHMLLIFVYIFRIVSLFGGIDVISDKIKQNLNKLWKSNPEEIFGYIRGFLSFLYYKITGGKLNHTLSRFVNNAKNTYSQIINYKQNPWIWGEYGLLFLLFVYMLKNIHIIINTNIMGIIYILPLIIWLGRYIISIYLNKMVHIPIAREIVIGVQKLIKFIK